MDLQTHLRQLQKLDDESLLCSLKRHVGSANRINALVLAHLAEVDARGAYRQWACDTLTAYCVYELRLSEDEAQRRCRAARVARQFPVLFEMLADGSIHLTGIVLLAPYLTVENHREVLARARYRRKREIELLVAELAPGRDVPALIVPLAVGMGARVPRSDWAAVAESSAGWVRQLVPGDGVTRAPSAPDDWHEELVGGIAVEGTGAPAVSAAAGSAPARRQVGPHRAVAGVAERDSDGAGQVNAVGASLDGAGADARAGAGGERPGASVRYKVQFTADQAYVDLLEQARGLLWHRFPDGNLAQLQRLALEALVEKLVLRKYGAGARDGRAEQRGRSAGGEAGGDGVLASEALASVVGVSLEGRAVGTEGSRVVGPEAETSDDAGAGAEVGPADAVDSALEREGAPSLRALGLAEPERLEQPTTSRCYGCRHVPAPVRSAVWLRDEGRCTYVDARGVRCRATAALELHHERAFARGGAATVENIRLRCRGHNELAAEEDFGREFVRGRKRGDDGTRGVR